MDVKTAFDRFIFSRKLANLSEKSIRNYQDFIKPFVVFIHADRDVATIEQSDIDGYILYLFDRSLSKASKSTYIRHLKIFLCWLGEQETLLFDPSCIYVPKSSRRVVRIYSDRDVEWIFKAIHTSSEWLTARNRAIIALMYDSGIRRAEVCSIKRNDVVFRENRIKVKGKGDKERIIPMGQLTRHFLKMYIQECPYRSESLFVTRDGNVLTDNAVKLMVAKLAKKLPFELSSHKLRHNFATNYCLDQYELNGHMDIYRLMYLMGHEDVETTRRYMHFANEVIAVRGCISHLDNVMDF